MTIRERILARPDLQQARLDKNIDALAAGLNEECQPALLPMKASLATILYGMGHSQVIIDFVQAVANGDPMQARAQELLSQDGVEVLIQGFSPPMVDRMEVMAAMYNDDGSEKE